MFHQAPITGHMSTMTKSRKRPTAAPTGIAKNFAKGKRKGWTYQDEERELLAKAMQVKLTDRLWFHIRVKLATGTNRPDWYRTMANAIMQGSTWKSVVTRKKTRGIDH